jgi:hypothetical protein
VSPSAHSPSRWGGFTAASDNINVALTIEDALKRAGVEFIDENGGGAGVRLRRRSKDSPRG